MDYQQQQVSVPSRVNGGSNAVYMRKLDNTKRFPYSIEVIGGSYEMKDNQCDMIQSFRPLAR